MRNTLWRDIERIALGLLYRCLGVFVENDGVGRRIAFYDLQMQSSRACEQIDQITGRLQRRRIVRGNHDGRAVIDLERALLDPATWPAWGLTTRELPERDRIEPDKGEGLRVSSMRPMVF